MWKITVFLCCLFVSCAHVVENTKIESEAAATPEAITPQEPEKTPVTHQPTPPPTLLNVVVETSTDAGIRGMIVTDRQLQIEHAILHIITEGLPKYKIKPFLNNLLSMDRTPRLDLVFAIDAASIKYDVPPMLLVAMAYREGSFKMTSVGKLNERSTFQMVSYVAKHIRDTLEPECDLTTYRGAALCTAAWLDFHRAPQRCGSLQGSFMIYATGKRCTPSTAHQVWLVRDRFGIARELEEITDYADKVLLISSSDKNGNACRNPRLFLRRALHHERHDSDLGATSQDPPTPS